MDRWQLMHEYAQKSISTTLPLRVGEVNRRAVWSVEPRLDALDGRRGATRLELWGPIGALVKILVLVVDEPAKIQRLARGVAIREALLNAVGVVREQPLQLRGNVEGEPNRERDHRDPSGDAQPALVPPKGADPLAEPAASKRKEQQRVSPRQSQTTR